MAQTGQGDKGVFGVAANLIAQNNRSKPISRRLHHLTVEPWEPKRVYFLVTISLGTLPAYLIRIIH